MRAHGPRRGRPTEANLLTAASPVSRGQPILGDVPFPRPGRKPMGKAFGFALGWEAGLAARRGRAGAGEGDLRLPRHRRPAEIADRRGVFRRRRQGARPPPPTSARRRPRAIGRHRPQAQGSQKGRGGQGWLDATVAGCAALPPAWAHNEQLNAELSAKMAMVVLLLALSISLISDNNNNNTNNNFAFAFVYAVSTTTYNNNTNTTQQH